MAMLCPAPRHAEDASSTHVYLPSLEGLACIKRPELDVAVEVLPELATLFVRVDPTGA